MKCRESNPNRQQITCLILAVAAVMATSTCANAQVVDEAPDFRSAVTARYDALMPATNSWARFNNVPALELQQQQPIQVQVQLLTFADLNLSMNAAVPASARQYDFGEPHPAASYRAQLAPTFQDPLQALLPPMPMPGGVEVRKVAFSDGLEIKLGLDLEPGRLGTRLMP